MNRFKEQLLGDVLDFYDHQRVPLSSLERDTRQGDYRYYGAQGVIDHLDSYIFDGQFILIAEDGANLVTRKEPVAFLVSGQFWVNNHAHVVKGKTGLADNFYITALLNNLNIAGFITGVAQPKLSQQNLRQIKVALPDYPTQRQIVAVLTAYDELMENNRRRMELLEESARLLYREWFVRLRFPGHEHARLTDGIPAGWERRTAYDAVEILSGGTPKTTNQEFWDGEIPFYTPKDATDSIWVTDCERTISEAGLKNCNSRLYTKEAVFISARGTVGKLNMAQRPMAMSQSCYALVGKDHVTQCFLFLAMREAVEALQQQAVGAVFDAIIMDTFKRITLLVPEPRMVLLFDDFARPVFSQLENLMLQNQKLRAARDLLLPRLMSGEIAV